MTVLRSEKLFDYYRPKPEGCGKVMFTPVCSQGTPCPGPVRRGMGYPLVLSEGKRYPSKVPHPRLVLVRGGVSFGWGSPHPDRTRGYPLCMYSTSGMPPVCRPCSLYENARISPATQHVDVLHLTRYLQNKNYQKVKSRSSTKKRHTRLMFGIHPHFITLFNIYTQYAMKT